MDLVLIHQLIMLNIPVIVHLKMNPTYVSDATSADVRWMLQALPEISSDFTPLVQRLETSLQTDYCAYNLTFFGIAVGSMTSYPPIFAWHFHTLVS